MLTGSIQRLNQTNEDKEMDTIEGFCPPRWIMSLESMFKYVVSDSTVIESFGLTPELATEKNNPLLLTRLVCWDNQEEKSLFECLTS